MEAPVNGQIRFAIAQATLPWQPILNAKSAKLVQLSSFVVLVFRNELEYRNVDARVKSAINCPTCIQIW